jgi:hypothetical protein
VPAMHASASTAAVSVLSCPCLVIHHSFRLGV